MAPLLETEFRLAWLNPLFLARTSWLQGRRGWSRLWRAPGPNARFFIGTTFLWSVAMAVTNPYKALFLSKLGLSNLAIGGFYALDMGLRIGGVLLGGLVAQRFGHKRTLLVFDFVSWVIPSVTLALATEPWQLYLATCLTSTNALVAGSVVQLLVDDTPSDRRASLFGLFSLTFVIPLILLPSFVGWGVEHWGLVPAMRAMFALTAGLTLTGILWRRVRLKESTAVNPGADLGELLGEALAAARHLAAQPSLVPVLGSYLLANAWTNLNSAYYGLYITRELGLGEAWVGILSTLGALSFVIASLGWVPRLRHRLEDRLFFWSSLLLAPAMGCLAFARGAAQVAALSLASGFISAIQGALLSERVASLLPPEREGLGQSLIASLMQASVALSLALGGALFEMRFGAFPYIVGAMALAQAALAWRMLVRSPACLGRSPAGG